MRLTTVLCCSLGLAFAACGLSPIEDVPSAGEANEGSASGGTGNGTGGAPVIGTGGSGTGGLVLPGAMAGAAGFAGAGGEMR
jgi:hypothetical protein